MTWSFKFFLNSILLGVGLTMDAFSVSIANAISEPDIKKRKMCLIAGTFAGFQALMPMIGWVCVHTILQYFSAFKKAVPWIALVLLCYIGGKMLFDGIRNGKDEAQTGTKLTLGVLLLQGIATSIDALSVGFTIAQYDLIMALAAALIIAAVTFAFCFGGLKLGKLIGTRLAGKATVVGGIILIFIGIEICFF